MLAAASTNCALFIPPFGGNDFFTELFYAKAHVHHIGVTVPIVQPDHRRI